MGPAHQPKVEPVQNGIEKRAAQPHRGAEEAGSVAGDIGDPLLRVPEFSIKRGRTVRGEGERVRVAVILHPMPTANNLAQQCRICASAPADTEKGCLGALCIQQVEDGRGDQRVRPVVEGERDLAARRACCWQANEIRPEKPAPRPHPDRPQNAMIRHYATKEPRPDPRDCQCRRRGRRMQTDREADQMGRPPSYVRLRMSTQAQVTPRERRAAASASGSSDLRAPQWCGQAACDAQVGRALRHGARRQKGGTRSAALTALLQWAWQGRQHMLCATWINLRMRIRTVCPLPPRPRLSSKM